jgi:hypothetical protein
MKWWVTYSVYTDSKETLERHYQEDAPVFSRLKSFGDKVWL